jgi:hypothetical protein
MSALKRICCKLIQAAVVQAQAACLQAISILGICSVRMRLEHP